MFLVIMLLAVGPDASAMPGADNARAGIGGDSAAVVPAAHQARPSSAVVCVSLKKPPAYLIK